MKGILFQPWKIKAISANPDKEWQTRRAGGLDVLNRKTDSADQPNSPDEYSFLGFDGKVADFSRYAGNHRGMSVGIIYHLKPRYLLGEVVYIKEAWCLGAYTYKKGADIIYKLGSKSEEVSVRTIPWNDWLETHSPYGSSNVVEAKWRSPRFMPAWAARYFVKIIGVREERTKDITPEDCLAEGIERHEDSGHNIFWFEPIGDYHGKFQGVTAHESYFALYDSINGDGAHKRNWNWKYSFVKVDKPEIPHSP